jgi:tripartite-type tricarboxylate transporter receptor subunit TctC
MRHVVALLSCIAGIAAAHAQEFPNKPLRLVVPWPPSGNVDITARTVAPAFAEALGQQVVVDNKPGASGRIGTEIVVKSPADGYTVMLGSTATITAGPAVFKSLPFDPSKDLVAVGAIQSVPMILTAAPKTPAANFQEFVALARKKPGALSIATPGSGTTNHLAVELLMRVADVKLLHVPYKGSGPAITDLLGSQVESMMDQLAASIGHIKEGRIRPIAIASKARSPQLPTVPTFGELGVQEFEADTFTGVFAPSGVPPQVVQKLGAALRKAMSVESVRERYRSMGVDIMDMDQAAFAAYVRADYEKWRRVARDGNIVVD